MALAAGSTGRGDHAPMTGMSHVQLRVTDLGVSVDWYRRALGLATSVADPDVGYAALRHPGARLLIILSRRAARTDDRSPATATDSSLDHLAFAVPDESSLRTWADHLSDIGIDHPGVVLEEGRPSLQLRDPDGIAIELVAPANRPGR